MVAQSTASIFISYITKVNVLFCSGTLVHKIDYRTIRHTRICGKSYLASARVRITDLDTVRLDLSAQFAECVGVGVEFRIGHTLIARKATTADTLGDKHLR